jgi:pimeloyl-ACP methyl ester carboxylesterase
MRKIEQSTGTIGYEDTGGDGPTIVLLHGLMMDASLWDGPFADLSADQRCVAPTLPLGAHRHAMNADADLSPPGIARLVAEFVDRLDLYDVTLVGNDTGGALVQLLVCDGAARVGRVVLASCEAFDNFPPRLNSHVRFGPGAAEKDLRSRNLADGLPVPCGTPSLAPAFIKICAYVPYPVKIWVNGHERAKRQAVKAGIGVHRPVQWVRHLRRPGRAAGHL